MNGYQIVQSDDGACPRCGGIDHRYVHPATRSITRSCDVHRLEWRVAPKDPMPDIGRKVVPLKAVR